MPTKTKNRADDLSREVEDSYVEMPVFERDYSHLKELYTYPIGDVHVGAASFQSGRFGEWITYLTKTKDTSMLGIGDFLNAAIPNSKSDPFEETMTPQDGIEYLEDKLGPLATDNRLDGITDGNHEDRIYGLTGIRPMRVLARSLDIDYYNGGALFRYKVGTQSYTVYVRHGTGNGQSPAGLTKSAMVADADLYITGHIHNQWVTADEKFVLNPETGLAERRRRYYVSSGAFLAYEKYASDRGYKPTRMGAPRIHFNGERHDIHVSI